MVKEDIIKAQLYFCHVLGETGITMCWGGLEGLPGGDTHGTGRPEAEGGDCWQEEKREQKWQERVDPEGCRTSRGGAGRWRWIMAGAHDLARAPQRPALPLLTSTGAVCARGPGWSGPTHHLPSPFILRSPARHLILPLAVGGWLSTSSPGHAGHLVHQLAELQAP